MNKKLQLDVSSSPTTASSYFSGNTASGITIDDTKKKIATSPKDNSATEKAVYAYIRALRALGHTTANTADIARALSLPLSDVDRAVQALKTKGVNVAA